MSETRTPREVLENLPGRKFSPFQIKDIETIIDNDGQALYAACLGSRKTATSVGLMTVLRGVWVVIAPLGTFGTKGDFITRPSGWLGAINEWAPDADVHVITAKNKTGLIDLKEDKSSFSIHLIGWEYMRNQDFSKFKNIDGAIADEVHRSAGYSTATSKSLWRINSKYRIGLSGTPANNKLHQLYNVCRWIWWGNKDHRNKNIFRRFKVMWGDEQNPGWVRRHFFLSVQLDKFGSNVGYDIGPEKRFHSVIEEVPCYIQHLEDERCCEFHPEGVNADLPDIEDPKTIYVEMTPVQKKTYKQIAGRAPVLWLDTAEGERGASVVANDNVARIRRRQIGLAVPSFDEAGNIVMAENAKSSSADALVDLMKDIVEDGEPVMVYTFSKQFAKLAHARVSKLPGIRAGLWTGDVKKDEREAMKSTFGTAHGMNVIVASIASIAEGVDGLQNVCRREVWIGEEENDMLNVQVIGRLLRTGQERRVQRWNIVTLGTAEMAQTAARHERRKNLKNALAADPGNDKNVRQAMDEAIATL